MRAGAGRAPKPAWGVRVPLGGVELENRIGFGLSGNPIEASDLGDVADLRGLRTLLMGIAPAVQPLLSGGAPRACRTSRRTCCRSRLLCRIGRRSPGAASLPPHIEQYTASASGLGPQDGQEGVRAALSRQRSEEHAYPMSDQRLGVVAHPVSLVLSHATSASAVYLLLRYS